MGTSLVAGVGAELIDRCGPDATLGPAPEIWGSKNPVEAAYWRVRTAALRDTVHWSPTVDPEVLKLVTNDIVRESNVHTLMHCWVVATRSCATTPVEGVIFESKQGRFALEAPVVIDCTGDGDVFAHGRRRVRRRLRRRERARAAHDELSLRQRRHAPLSGLPDAASVRVQRDHAARVAARAFRCWRTRRRTTRSHCSSRRRCRATPRSTSPISPRSSSSRATSHARA